MQLRWLGGVFPTAEPRRTPANSVRTYHSVGDDAANLESQLWLGLRRYSCRSLCLMWYEEPINDIQVFRGTKSLAISTTLSNCCCWQICGNHESKLRLTTSIIFHFIELPQNGGPEDREFLSWLQCVLDFFFFWAPACPQDDSHDDSLGQINRISI